GWEFLDEFKRIANSIKKTIVIYIVSSSISPSDINKANQQENVRDYIIKPITKKKFIELLENFV
ncbi:MAG TPA: response regulator, partial [Bacteroidia bacterium]